MRVVRPARNLIQSPQKPQAPLYSSCGLMCQSRARQHYIDGDLGAGHALKVARSEPRAGGAGRGSDNAEISCLHPRTPWAPWGGPSPERRRRSPILTGCTETRWQAPRQVESVGGEFVVQLCEPSIARR